MAEPVEGLQPSVLRWARESQGYAISEIALRLKRSESDIIAWESGAASPTYSQLEKLAYEVYKRPLAVFFLPAPPPEPDIKEQFRTLPDFEIESLSPDTRYQLRLADSYRHSLWELSDGVNPAQEKIFRDLEITERDDVQKTAGIVRDYLKVTMQIQASWKSSDEALKTWRNRVEEAGVFVFKHAIKQQEVSGFCLVDDEFPIIYLNNTNAKTRQIFTLHHELAHLLLNVSTITVIDDSYMDSLAPQDKRIERFCNALAAEILVPSSDFSDQVANLATFDEDTIERLANRYWVSRETVLRRLFDAHLVSQKYYRQKVSEWNKQAPKKGGGGNYYLTQATYLGEAYLRLVFGKLYQGRLTHSQAAEHLGVKTKNLAGLEEVVLGKGLSA